MAMFYSVIYSVTFKQELGRQLGLTRVELVRQLMGEKNITVAMGF